MKRGIGLVVEVWIFWWLWYFLDKVEASLSSLGSVKNDGMYVGYKEIGGDGTNGNGEVQDGKYGMRLPIEIPNFLL